MSTDPTNGNTLTYRITQLEREVEKLETRWDTSFSDLRSQMVMLTREVAVFHAEFNAHVQSSGDRLDQLEGSVNEDVRGLRRLLLGTGGAVLVAAITFAISAFKVFGGPG